MPSTSHFSGISELANRPTKGSRAFGHSFSNIYTVDALPVTQHQCQSTERDTNNTNTKKIITVITSLMANQF